MKLYYTAGACSLSPHIILEEGGFEFELEKVDLRTKQTETGADYTAINPKGSIPALELDNGEILTEGPAIVQYLADLVPDKKLAPTAGTIERARVQEWLNYISSEVHKNFGPMFRPDSTEDAKAAALEILNTRFSFVNAKLKGNDYLLGEQFSVADAYLFTTLSWTKHLGLDMSEWSEIGAYMGRVGARQAVQDTLRAEGLIE